MLLLLRFLAEKQHIFGIIDAVEDITDPAEEVDAFLKAHGTSVDRLRNFGDPANMSWLRDACALDDQCCEELAYAIVAYEIFSGHLEFSFSEEWPLLAKAIGVSEQEFRDFLFEMQHFEVSREREAIAS